MSSSKQPRILIVEDEYLIRLTLVEALTDEGYDVIEAESGDEALPVLQSDAMIDLLLTDVQLPGQLDGRLLADQARQSRPALPVLFMTGHPDPTAEAAVGARERFIAKPYTLADICRTAAEMLAGG